MGGRKGEKEVLFDNYKIFLHYKYQLGMPAAMQWLGCLCIMKKPRGTAMICKYMVERWEEKRRETACAP